MKKLFRRKKKSASEAGSVGSGLSGSGYNISPKKDLGKLHKAAYDGDLTKLKSMLKRGDVNQLDKENRTPLHLACANGKFEAVRMLCEHQNINLNLCDNDRQSALMKCVQCEHQTCLNILLQKEADVSLCDNNGNTALHVAASIPNSDICYLLCDYKADPRAKNKDGSTPLHIAAGLGSDEIVRHMLELGVDVNDVDDNEKTALMHAAHKGHLTTVKLLLSKNANASLRDISGWTADDYASMDGFHPISHVIVEHNMKKGQTSTKTTPSRQSTISRTPQTTPQKLGIQSSQQSMMDIGGPALDGGDSQSDDSQSASRLTNDRDSWASSNSEDDEPKYAKVKKKKSPEKPKINLMQLMKMKKKTPTSSADATAPSPISTSPSHQPMQSPSKTTTNLFLTSSARQQLEQQESEDKQDSDILEEREMRSRYDSKSARGLPVSPDKPPLPKPRSSTSLDKIDAAPITNAKKLNDSDGDSPWDSSDNEDSSEHAMEHRNITPAVKITDQRKVVKPDSSLLNDLGFDANDVKNIYNSDEDTDISRSESAATGSPAKSTKPNVAAVTSPSHKVKVQKVNEDSDSWDASNSEEKPSPAKQLPAFDFMKKSTAFKFDDETDSDSDSDILKPDVNKGNVKSNQLAKDNENVDDDDDDSSWNSDNIVKRPEQAPEEHSYVSSSPAVLQDAEKMVSPQHRSAFQYSPNRKPSTGFNYGAADDSNSFDSEEESESSWEEQNRLKKSRALNNQKDLEKENKKTLAEEAARKMEEKRKRDEEERLRKEAEEKRILDENRKQEEMIRQKEEEHKRIIEEKKIQEENRRKEAEKKQRDIEELEKLNRMNEELERKSAELKKKIELEEEWKKEEAKKLETTTPQMNESLRIALERAVDVTSESGDSESYNKEDQKIKAKQPAKMDYLTNSSIPPLSSGTVKQRQQISPRDIIGATNHIDLDTLTEETETDDDLSLSEHRQPPIVHTSPLSDSLKLAEEKQNLSLQLAREQDVAASTQDKLEKIKFENKELKSKERMLSEEKKNWELEKVEMNAENRKLNFEIKNLQENLETLNCKMTQQNEKFKRTEEQLQVEKEERREQEITVRDLRTDLKTAKAASKQAELDCEELKKKLASEKESRSLAQTMNQDSLKLSTTLQNEAKNDKKVESLEQVVHEKNQELIKVKAERDRYEDASARYKEELGKLRSLGADQHGDLAQFNQELNEKLDEKEEELRESEEALQLTALQSVQFKQEYEKCAQQLAEERREKENAYKDLNLLNNQQEQLKKDLNDSRSLLLREQERTRKLEDSNEKIRDKEANLQSSLLTAESKASRLENELQIAQSSNKQRVEDTAKWENECEKLRESVKENEKNSLKLERENAEQSGKIEALKLELHQRESECMQMRQEREDLRSRNTMTTTEQQEKFNSKLADVHLLLEKQMTLQRDHENERVAFETRNVQLTQQIEHWKSEADRIEREKAFKDEELAQAQQDRIEVHKKLGYADAFSKSASKEQKQLMEDNTKFKQENIKLQSQVSLFEQKLEEKCATISELQKDVDKFYQTSANANRQIDSLSESQRLVETNRAKLEQQLKDIELENIRLKSELDSANSWKDRLQEGREEEAHAKVMLEEKLSRLECDKVLVEEKMAAELANAKMLQSEAEGHRSMWEAEVKSRSKLEVELSKANKDVDGERTKSETLKNKLTRALEDRKTYKTKYDQMKRDKVEAERRAESYRSAMHDAGRKVSDLESDCESQISSMDEQHNSERSKLEATIAKLREQVADLAMQMREKKKPYFPEGPTENTHRSDETKRVQFENEKLKEELRRLRSHVESSYVDKSELEAARQEERIKAQAALAPTLDQVNSYLKDRQMAQDMVDNLRLKNEEHRFMQAAMKITSLEEELASLKRKGDDFTSRRIHEKEAELSQLYDSAKRQNDVLQQQLSRANNKAEEYKANWIKERKKFQSFFSSTLGGSIIPSQVDTNQFSTSNGFPGFSQSRPNLSATPPMGGAFSSTPKKDPSAPLLNQLRTKLDASIAQHLVGTRGDAPMFHSTPLANGHISPRSSLGTPRSDGSSRNHGDDIQGTSGHKSTNEYMSFLLT
ncbi:uncharacterized protein LOC120336758 isoform X2 [Styela clava]